MSRAQLVVIKRRYEHRRSRLGSSRRHLGALEYTLLGLMVLGVAITIVMAIVNP